MDDSMTTTATTTPPTTPAPVRVFTRDTTVSLTIGGPVEPETYRALGVPGEPRPGEPAYVSRGCCKVRLLERSERQRLFALSGLRGDGTDGVAALMKYNELVVRRSAVLGVSVRHHLTLEPVEFIRRKEKLGLGEAVDMACIEFYDALSDADVQAIINAAAPRIDGLTPDAAKN